MNKKPSGSFLIRRGLAYILDIFFISIITMLVTQINFINPNKDQYAEANSRYEELVNKTNNIEEILKDENVNDIMYDIARYGAVYTLVGAAIYVAYFVGFQRATGGQSLGKRIFKIKVTNKDMSKVKWWQLLVRSLMIYGIIPDIACGIAINFLTKQSYMSFSSVISTIFQILTYVTVIVMAFRDDGRGLHDLLAQTTVIDLKVPEVSEKETKEVVKEAEFEEVKEVKKTTKKKTTSKEKSNKNKSDK